MRHRQPPTVFISYAHESDVLRASVAALAEWLGGHGCRVFTDHAYVDRPPPEGWQGWMNGCIEKADTVLVVCTPRLKRCYERGAVQTSGAVENSGRGITYEGAIVTQHIYDAFMENTKFYPILSDGGREDDIPRHLKPWWNGHRFPGGNEGIRRLVFAEPRAAGPSGTSPDEGAPAGGPPWSIGTRQERVVAERLAVGDILPFFDSLRNEMADAFPQTPAPKTAAEMVQRLAECPAGEVQEMFFVVRRALLQVRQAGRDRSVRQAAEEAAAALYWLAACRLVDQAARSAPKVMHVPSDEHIVCAIIATALFGGELRVKPAAEPGLPAPEYVYEVRVPASGDRIDTDFERAAYVALFPNDREATEIALDTGPLDEKQRKRLAARFRTIQKVHRASLALVVPGFVQAEAIQGFATTHAVPVLLPAGEAATALLGMEAGTLVAEIREFWAELEVLSRPASQPPAHEPAP